MATVLVVDDQADNRRLLRALFGGRGHRVLEAADDSQAFVLARGEHPDVVVATVLMPGMDGYELVRELRADPDTTNTPVIFSTPAYLEQEVRPIAQACGVTRVLLGAPPDLQSLAEAVDAALIEAALVEATREAATGADAPVTPGALGTPGTIAAELAGEHTRSINARLVRRIRELEATLPAAPGQRPSPTARDGLGDEVFVTALGEMLAEAEQRNGAAATPGWLRVAERLDSADQLAAEVGHDFNNVLSVILAYTKSIGDTAAEAAADGSLDREISELILSDVDRILRAGDRAAHLTRSLLDFAHRERHAPATAEVGPVLSAVAQTLTRATGGRVEISTEVAPGLPPVAATAEQLHRLVLAVGHRLREAVPDGGWIGLVGGRPAPRPGPPRAERVQVTVTAGRGPARVPMAASLELPEVSALLAGLGGTLRVAGETGAGLRVELLLPAATAEAAAPHPAGAPDAPAPAGGTETVLVAEDEEALRDNVTGILRGAGYHVLAAPDGAAALAEADRYKLPIHLLLTDAVMPQLLGREVAERLLSLRPGLRVLYMSGYAPAIMSAPGLYGLSKPFTEVELLTSVRRILDANS